MMAERFNSLKKYSSESEPSLSLEFFPPKNASGWGTLYSTLGSVMKSKEVDFCSITCGAGGLVENPLRGGADLSIRVKNELNINAMAHITCIASTVKEVSAVLDDLRANHVNAIMALRGDFPPDRENFKFKDQNLKHGSDLIHLIRKAFPEFVVGCAAYCEKHPEASSLQEDIEYLKLKQELGANFAVTQLFLDNEVYYSFVRKCREAGVTIPIVPGIMPIMNVRQLNRAQDLSSCSVPDDLKRILEKDDAEEVRKGAIDFTYRQCLDLLQHDVPGIHLYSLNKASEVMEIVDLLRSTSTAFAGAKKANK